MPRRRPLFAKALAIRRKVLGEEHPDTAVSYNNLAFNLNSQGKYAEARAALREGAGHPPQGAGRGASRHGRQLQQPGLQPGSQGKYAEAQPLFEKALAICRKVLGEEHPDTATSYNNLADQPEPGRGSTRRRSRSTRRRWPSAARCWARSIPTRPQATTTWPST